MTKEEIAELARPQIEARPHTLADIRKRCRFPAVGLAQWERNELLRLYDELTEKYARLESENASLRAAILEQETDQ